MLNESVEMVEADLQDTSRSEFRTLFVTKRAAKDLLRAADYYQTMQEVAVLNGTSVVEMLSSHINEEQRLRLLSAESELSK